MNYRATIRLHAADAALLAAACDALDCTPAALFRHWLRLHAGVADDIDAHRAPNGTGRRKRHADSHKAG